jgi:hypothetical protein
MNNCVKFLSAEKLGRKSAEIEILGFSLCKTRKKQEYAHTAKVSRGSKS